MMSFSCQRVLFVDDDADMRRANEQTLKLEGFETTALASAHEALAIVDDKFEGAVVTDMRMPGMDGLELLTRVMVIDPELPVIMVTGHGDVELAVRSIRQGAYDFITKPFSRDELIQSLRRALEKRSLTMENRRLHHDVDRAELESALIGRSPQTERLRKTIEQLGPADIDVLIQGETGTGKSLIAALLHRASRRNTRPLVTIDLASMPPAAIESELFGYAPGLNGPGSRAGPGRVLAADGGTILFDNVDSLSLDLQPRLLRLMEDRVVNPIGGIDSHPVELRVIATSERDLATEVEAGRFSKALYFRLNAVTLKMAPLRERREDVPLLFAHFLRDAARRHKRAIPEIGENNWRMFGSDPLPGNARQLYHHAERTVLGLSGVSQSGSANDGGVSLRERVASFEAEQLRVALHRADGDVSIAADSLQIPRKTLYDKLKRYSIPLER